VTSPNDSHLISRSIYCMIAYGNYSLPAMNFKLASLYILDGSRGRIHVSDLLSTIYCLCIIYRFLTTVLIIRPVIFYPPPSTQQAVFVFTPPPVLAFYQLGYGPPAQPSFLPRRLAPQPAFAPPRHSYYYAQPQTVRYQFAPPPH
jgi:hypothetical protein